MKNKQRIIIGFLCASLLFFCLFTACTPSPDNARIETAIRTSLSKEESPPALDFNRMEVPMRSAGKANAVLWTENNEIRRDYVLEYDNKTGTFVVAKFTTSHRNANGTYYPVPDDPGLVLTDLAPCFNFSDDFSQKYLLFNVGKGDSLADLRSAFESKKLPNVTDAQLADFDVCDLGGDTLILLVPRYKGLYVWINELEHRGDMMISGAEIARFEGEPIYIYCEFSDDLPKYEVHISFNGLEESFNTREDFLKSIR